VNEVFIVVEGPTEQRFLEDVLAPWVAQSGVFIHASRVGKPGHKGGNRYSAAKRDILNFLKQRSDTIVSCMFDFYGMGSDWPGREDANTKNQETKPVTVEKAIYRDIVAEMPDAKKRLIPYVQMHEFEALLFSFPPSLAIALGDRDADEDFQEIRDAFETPEHINDNPNSAPSKRIEQIFSNYGRTYRKTLHGSIATQKMEVTQIRKECPHFSAWLALLLGESL
jgi:Domain of unknown function (DUF4276)